LLDSNIIIYAAEPNHDGLRRLIAQHECVVSVISKVEVLGYHKLGFENRQKLEQLFQLLPVLALSDAVIDEAISLRQQRKMSLGDSLIAATALTYNRALVTANVADYTWIDTLEVINPLLG